MQLTHNTPFTTKDELAHEIYQLVMASSVRRYKQYSGENAHPNPKTALDPSCFGHWTTFMMTSEQNIRLYFTFYYHASELIDLVEQKYGVPIFDDNETLTQDYANELCNQIAGAIQRGMMGQNIQLKIGLPMPNMHFGPPGIPHYAYENAFGLETAHGVFYIQSNLFLLTSETWPGYTFTGISENEQSIEDYFNF
jgi:hypothetical protein